LPVANTALRFLDSIAMGRSPVNKANVRHSLRPLVHFYSFRREVLVAGRD
jgi:hypothetical protein